MPRKAIRPLRTDAEHKAALVEIEQYFEREPKPGTPAGDRFDVLARAIENYERKRWPIGKRLGSPGQARR
jgi:HTH-type transcriptional regulator/antitoxin HigA